jgi:hypothetical protein
MCLSLTVFFQECALASASPFSGTAQASPFSPAFPDHWRLNGPKMLKDIKRTGLVNLNTTFALVLH